MNLPDWVLNLIAGVLGGSIQAARRPAEPLSARVITAATGGIVAVYLTPIVAPLVQPYVAGADGEAVAGFCGFLTGFAGLSMAEAFIHAIQRKLNIGEPPPKRRPSKDDPP